MPERGSEVPRGPDRQGTHSRSSVNPREARSCPVLSCPFEKIVMDERGRLSAQRTGHDHRERIGVIAAFVWAVFMVGWFIGQRRKRRGGWCGEE
jgi:hypothetical protein